MPAQPEALSRLGPLPAEAWALGFSAWKRPYLRLLWPGVRWHHADAPEHLPPHAVVLAWGGHAARVPPTVAALWHVEDGFLRSVGLGADLVRPLSWTVDTRAAHFDAAAPSDLEGLLAERPDAATLDAAAHLREAIVAARLSKYNVGRSRWQPPRGTRKLVVVAGQVESDAALRRGAPQVCSNLGLLQAVRRAEPAAHIVYKTHPDVAARLRRPGAGEHAAARWCDEVVADVPMPDLIDAADELHVMTSLAGFEALLRGKRVVCHGLPFYAGWGLTEDRLALPRRRARLSLDALVAGALLRYPLYFSRDGRRLASAAEVVDELMHWRATQGGRAPWWRPALRAVLRHTVGVQ